MVKRTLQLCLFVASGVVGGSAETIEPEWRSFTTPEYSGHIFTFKYPKDWKITEVYERAVIISSPVGDADSDPHLRVSIGARDLKETDAFEAGKTDPEDWQTPEMFDEKYLRKHIDFANQTRIYQSRRMTLLGQDGLFRAVSLTERYIPKLRKLVKPTGPTWHEYHAVIQEHIHAVVKVRGCGPKPEDALKSLSAQAEEVAKSMTVRPVSSLSKEEKDRIVPRYYDSGDLHISQRRDYYVDVAITTLAPPGWEVKEVRKTLATDQREQGEFVVEFIARGKDKNDYGARMTVVLGGMPVSPLSKNDFLATGGNYVDQIIPKNKILKTEEVDLAGTKRLASLHPRRFESTEKTSVSTFTGHDALGRELKVKIYTAGGMTVVSHFIYSAEAKHFEKMLPIVDRMIRVMSVYLQYPSP